MGKEDIEKQLGMFFWDRKLDACRLKMVLDKEIEREGDVTLPKLYLRMLESIQWETILEMVNPEQIDEILSPDVIKRLWRESLKKKYMAIVEFRKQNKKY